MNKSPKSPELLAQQAMRPTLPKRFYKGVDTAICEAEGYGYNILLDGRTLKTPGKNAVIIPTQSAAKLVAAEWVAQVENIDPATMPMTRLVNTAIDGIAADPQPVIEDMLKFASSDLLCYRATSPQELVDNQRQLWDPVLEWLEVEIGAQFKLSDSLQFVTQPKPSIAAVGQKLRQWKHPIEIGALHTSATMCGSLFLAVALAAKQINAEQCWKAAHVDEDWNISQWGEDHEAQVRRAKRWEEFNACHQLFLSLEG